MISLENRPSIHSECLGVAEKRKRKILNGKRHRS